MPLGKEIHRLLIAILIAFGAVALSAAYWAIIGPDTIARRDDNPRLVVAEAAIRRGSIVDRNGTLLAESVPDDNGQLTRQYMYAETSSFLGYSSLRYGVGGIEAAYDEILRGDDLQLSLGDQLLAMLLHRPQVGSDLQLTLDLNIQRVIAQSMAGEAGAAVVLAVPGGEIIGLVSLPTYDPNTLDENWDTLAESPDKPFFNRALQGSYQPGGTLQTPLMAAALVAKTSLTEGHPDGTAAVVLNDDIHVNCALRLPFDELSLRDAYAFACPAPFVDLAEQLGSQAVMQTLQTFHFDQPPTVVGYPQPIAETVDLDNDTLTESALGQGNLTVMPLQMAVMAAAIVNDGNAPHPYALLNTRAPDTSTWTPATTTPPTIPFMTQDTARQLQDLMRNTVANGAALNAARPGIDIGGHTTLAYSGEESQAWFIGFATLDGARAVAVAIALENSDDPGRAADIGGTILAAAHQALGTSASPEN